MSHQLIEAFSQRQTPLPTPTSDVLLISEMFSDTLQGEGVSSGKPAVFMRLQGCLLDCVWCDTAEVWRKGNPYTFTEICDLILDRPSLFEGLEDGTVNLIITGGSPLKQQKQVARFLNYFRNRFHFYPTVEIENECVVEPIPELYQRVFQWNNSPKLANSEMKRNIRYKPDVIKFTASLPNSYFKVVVESEEDWSEIKKDFLDPGLIQRNQLILMPCGQTQEQLHITRPLVAEMAIREKVRFSDRLHVTIWDKKTGV